jgi:hypothetical protein
MHGLKAIFASVILNLFNHKHQVAFTTAPRITWFSIMMIFSLMYQNKTYKPAMRNSRMCFENRSLRASNIKSEVSVWKALSRQQHERVIHPVLPRDIDDAAIAALENLIHVAA